jgi:hypothetical protein
MLTTKNGLVMVGALGVLAGLFGLFSLRPAQVETVPEEPSVDPTRVKFGWRDATVKRRIGFFNPVRDAAGPGPEVVANLEALGYLDGYERPTDATGVLIHDTERVQPGYNLYVSAHAPAAHLMDMSGEVVHRWERTYGEVCPGEGDDGPGQNHWRRAKLLENGDLLVVFDYYALVRLDKSSNPIWTLCGRYHHDVTWNSEGRVFALRTAPRSSRDGRSGAPAPDDLVEQISPEGDVLASTSLLDALEKSRFSDLLDGLRGRDELHTNTITLLEGPVVEGSRQFSAGQVLLSFRNLDALAVLDLESDEIVWATRGPWKAQHEPVLLENGSVLLFDNLGLGQSSRILEYDLATHTVGWSYPKTPSPSFFSAVCGSQQRLSNGNTLIVESTAGRAIEVTSEGEVVWEFRSAHRVKSKGKELVALIGNLYRVSPAAVESWLGRTDWTNWRP